MSIDLSIGVLFDLYLIHYEEIELNTYKVIAV